MAFLVLYCRANHFQFAFAQIISFGYALKEEEVEVLPDAVSTSNVLFTSGYASYLEVINAQKSVLEAELELANIKKGIFHSVIGLYKALGGGWSWR